MRPWTEVWRKLPQRSRGCQRERTTPKVACARLRESETFSARGDSPAVDRARHSFPSSRSSLRAIVPPRDRPASRSFRLAIWGSRPLRVRRRAGGNGAHSEDLDAQRFTRRPAIPSSTSVAVHLVRSSDVDVLVSSARLPAPIGPRSPRPREASLAATPLRFAPSARDRDHASTYKSGNFHPIVGSDAVRAEARTR